MSLVILHFWFELSAAPCFCLGVWTSSLLVPGSPNGMAYRVYSLPGHAHQRICMPGRCAKLELRRKHCQHRFRQGLRVLHRAACFEFGGPYDNDYHHLKLITDVLGVLYEGFLTCGECRLASGVLRTSIGTLQQSVPLIILVTIIRIGFRDVRILQYGAGILAPLPRHALT